MSEILLPDGTPARMGCIAPPTPRYSAVPAWSDKNPVLSEDECEDHDDFKDWTPPIINQPFSNCTNASLCKLVESSLWRMTGVKPPTLSQTWLWAHFNGGSTQNGAMCRELAEKVRIWGCPTDALFPATKYSIPKSGSPKEIVDDAKTRVALEVYQCENWADVRSALARRFLVYYGFVLGGLSKWTSAPANGKIAPFDGQRVNGHAQWGRGLTRRFGDLRVINVGSWGTSVADKGVSYVDSSYFWPSSGNYVNLECFAFRSFVHNEPVPKA